MPVGRLSAAAGLVLLSSRVEESLDALRHLATLFALELVQLFCCRLGSSYIFRGRGIDGAICPEQVGDGHAALLDRAKAAGPCRGRRAANGAIHLPLVSF